MGYGRRVEYAMVWSREGQGTGEGVEEGTDKDSTGTEIVGKKGERRTVKIIDYLHDLEIRER